MVPVIIRHDQSGTPMDAATASPASPASRRPLHVLLADDDEFSREVVRHLLVSAGHTVHVVSNGREALEAVQSPQRFDVMLLDVRMPEPDGFQVIKVIRQAEGRGARRLPVIALTALTRLGDREQCIDAGMNDYLPKPIRMAQLNAALERVTAVRAGRGDPPSRADEIASNFDANSDLLDAATILASCGGDETLLREMIDLYIAGAQPRLAAVEHAVDAGDSAALRLAAHKLKGLVSAFSGKTAQAVGRLETLGAEGRAAETGEALREAREHVVALVACVRGLTLALLRC
jgi:CheY-like chemotaxis protein/HPt (histidine-containing phosphotransfer) domain-containing protein